MKRGPQPWALARCLNTLRAAEGRPVTYAQLLDALMSTDRRALPVIVYRLRERGFPIEGVRGYGYRFKPWPHLWEVKA